jgi:quinol monooxygenase YgiN
MIRVISNNRVPLENQEAFKAIVKPLVEATLKEEGCIEYGLHTDEADPELLVFFEVWESRANLSAHMETPHFKQYAPEMAKLRTDKDLLILSQII